MSTSLQEQLQRLAVPQTMTLADSRSKASVLFDRKEAGTKTRRIIYEIGLAGLQELTALNPIFQTFENTLFNESTIELERSVEHTDVNKLIDRNINKFLQHLSPYFLLRPTLMCLEWLIRRFHIQEYNRNELLALALPYHETNTFILILQVIRIKQADQEWNWLHPLQKPGVPVPKTVLINRAASDVAFLKFVCQATLDAVKELGTRANSLQTQLNFYASVVVGALEHAAAVEEWHIITILPSLLKGLQSEVLDFAAASYIVATQLVARTQVTPKLCNALLERAASVSLERLRQTAVLFLVFLFDKQHRAKPHFSDNTLLHLATQKWFIANLAALAKGNVYLHALYVALLQQALSAIQAEHKDSEALKSFLERLLNEVALNDDSAQEIINAFLNAYEEQPLSPQKALQDGEMIELSSDDDEEMVDNNSNFQAWYSEYLRKLERKYPVAFDHTIKEGLTSNSQEFANKRSVLKMALGFRLKTFDPSATDIYEQLYHHTAKIRAFAVQTLLVNLRDYSARPQNMHLLRECLADRIADDSELVVTEILKLPTAEFVQVLGADNVAEALIAILNKVQQDAEHWAPLTAVTVQHLTSREIVETYDTNIILLALMPLLFPDSSSSNTFRAITSILKSPLSAKIGFLQELKLVRDSESFNAVEFKKQFLDVISKSTATPTGLSLFRSAETHGERIFKNALHFSHFLLLATACLKTDLTGTEAGYIFTQIRTTYRRFRVRQLESKQWDMVKEKCIPLQLFSDFIVSLAQHTHFEHLFEWEQIHDDLRTFFDIFNLLAEEGFQQSKAAAQQTEWLRTLKEVFDHIFDNAQQKLEFLSNFYVYESNAALGADYALLRLRAFKLTNALFKNKNNKLHINTSHVFRIASALNAPSETMRLQALETLQVLKACTQLSAPLQHFVDSILARSYEFSMDHEQFPLILYTILKPTHKKQQPQSLKVLREIVQLVTAEDALQHAAFTAQILKTLKHIDDASLLADLIPLGARTLTQTHVEDALLLLPQPYSTILQLICDRFEHQTIGTVLLDQTAAWQFIVQLFGAHNVYIQHGGKLRAVPCVLLEALDEYCYEQIPQNYKTDLIKLIVQTMAATDTDAVFLSANKLLKRCSINCAPLVELLAQMSRIVENNEASAGAAAKRKSTPTSATKRDAQAQNQLTTQVTTKAWKQGVALLELLEHKKKLEESEQLLPALFDLLRFCLELEEQAVVEYTKQLTLSTLLHCCQLAQASGVQLAEVLPKSTFRIDLIVQCVRGAQNPQTQNNALLLLSHCAALFPHQVLHSVVDVFTFMGSSVVRHDDAFSFHIINNVIESIVPILVRSGHADGAVDNTSTVELVIPVLKVFSDILLDVPEHRRLPLYSKLLLTLGAEQFLWIFLCIVFEAHVLEDEKQRLLQRKHKNDKPSGPAAAAAEKYSKRVEVCLELTNQFAPEITLDTCIELLGYIKSLPMDKADTEGAKGKAKKAIDTTEQCLFDVKCRTAKQLRHYKYVIMQYLSGISSSPQFLRKIAMLSDAEQLAIKPYYQNFIIKTLTYIPLVNTAIETVEETSQLKFWKVILHHLHDVLDNAISLLSPDMFLVVVYGLMRHQLVSIRKKVIELLINKLQQRDGYFDRSDPQNFYNLLEPLSDITMGILTQHESSSATPGTASPSTPTNELVFLQQTALIAIKLLSKMFALQHIKEFKEILAHLIKVLKQRSKISKIVLATVVLTIIEISSNLKAHSLALLPKYMPQMIEILQDQAKLVQSQLPDNVCIAIITGTQKLFESLPLFLGPYVVDVITALSTISANISAQQSERDQRAATALHRISTIWSKIASDVPVRILVPSCEKAYRKLMAAHNYADIAVLMQLLPECINKTPSAELTAVQSELGAFFLHTLEFRLQVRNNCERERVASTETVIIDAFVTWVLKLSESSFRPYYQKVYEWAIKQRAERETILTFFLLTNKIAEALKTLFALFARDGIIDDAANLLNEYNAAKQNIEADQEALTSDIVKSILSTLYTLFLHDSKGFVNNRRFEVLMQPLVDQLENRLVLESEELQQVLQMCVAQLAAAVSNDIMWKQLNYQVLMKTRTNVPEVRILSFNCCLEIARKLGEDFTPLLPETVPFVAELLEDENQRVEKNTRKAVQELENILGESLQSYL
ncbi:LOW QUALITY PROTEIN: HEAT repeat-containing protein 1 homolog [Bactrocera neohumeralis]|uniref:LOW QUALITY PROTEIN: HEAT repeat-containing protein 1 homolog n=1 Tax=Bactrocera neohumeralis TaxID=98809 RepID=UPI0021662995|nr:LOW QUALITY PROTEIN: HEAT repeat-containing protein 1 homolog [Bactrocera neohumeralis]